MDEYNQKKRNLLIGVVILAIVLILIVSLLFLIFNHGTSKDEEVNVERGLITESSKTPSVNKVQTSPGPSEQDKNDATYKDGDIVEEGINYKVTYTEDFGYKIDITGEDIVEKTKLPFSFSKRKNKAYGLIYKAPMGADINESYSNITDFFSDNITVSVCISQNISSLNNMNSNAPDLIKKTTYRYDNRVYSNLKKTDEWHGFLATKTKTTARDRFKFSCSTGIIGNKVTVNAAAYYVLNTENGIGVTIVAKSKDEPVETLDYIAYYIGQSLEWYNPADEAIDYTIYKTDDNIGMNIAYPDTWTTKKNGSGSSFISFNAPASSSEPLSDCRIIYSADSKDDVSDISQYPYYLDESVRSLIFSDKKPQDDEYSMDWSINKTDITRIFGHDAVVYDLSYRYSSLSNNGIRQAPALGNEVKVKLYCFTKSGYPACLGFIYNSNTENAMIKLIEKNIEQMM